MKTKSAVLFVVAALSFAASPALADDSQPRIERKPNTAAIVTGASLLGTAYVISVLPTIGADVGGDHEFDPLYAPIVGPFIAAARSFANANHSTGYFGSWGQSIATGMGVIFVVDGITQVAGVVTLVAGLATPRRIKMSEPRIRVTPVVGKTMTGLGASFAF